MLDVSKEHTISSKNLLKETLLVTLNKNLSNLICENNMAKFSQAFNLRISSVKYKGNYFIVLYILLFLLFFLSCISCSSCGLAN